MVQTCQLQRTFSLGRKYRQRGMLFTATQQLQGRGQEGAEAAVCGCVQCHAAWLPDVGASRGHPHLPKQVDGAGLVVPVLICIQPIEWQHLLTCGG